MNSVRAIRGEVWGRSALGGQDAAGKTLSCNGRLREWRSLRCTWNYADTVHRRNEPVAAPGQRLDEPGIARRIAQRFTNPVYGGVDSVFIVDEGVVRPQGAANLLARHQLSRALQQKHQDLEGLGSQPDAQSLAAEFAGDGIGLESPEAIARGCGDLTHPD